MSVVIETTVGELTVDLFLQERPIACLNFLKLCQLKYYNYNLFHTIESDFIAQSGDPSGSGNEGSSVWGLIEGPHKRFFEAEEMPKIVHSTTGLLSLVSAGRNLVGSQFFFTLGDNLTSLDGIHCVIGEVVEGHETLRKLNEAIVDENFRPYQDIRVTHTVILNDPFPNPRGFKAPARSPSPSAERLKNGRIAADEHIDDTNGKTMEEIQEMLAEREAKARATILEIVGDIPDADVAPPENVLFVCKLNPVTNDDDLSIIFSRFGKVKNCEVIRDRKTGESLQYAFVEFEDRKACEAAYFKMDNVLIDDRRIHVDFSQSVSKVKWRGKGCGVHGSQERIDFHNLRDGTRWNEHHNDNNRNYGQRDKLGGVDHQRDRSRKDCQRISSDERRPLAGRSKVQQGQRVNGYLERRCSNSVSLEEGRRLVNERPHAQEKNRQYKLHGRYGNERKRHESRRIDKDDEYEKWSHCRSFDRRNIQRAHASEKRYQRKDPDNKKERNEISSIRNKCLKAHYKNKQHERTKTGSPSERSSRNEQSSDTESDSSSTSSSEIDGAWSVNRSKSRTKETRQKKQKRKKQI